MLGCVHYVPNRGDVTLSLVFCKAVHLKFNHNDNNPEACNTWIPIQNWQVPGAGAGCGSLGRGKRSLQRDRHTLASRLA